MPSNIIQEATLTTRAAPILVSVSVSGQYQHFDGIRIGQVHYTSTNSVVLAILSMKYFLQSYQAKIMMKKLTMTANSIVLVPASVLVNASNSSTGT